MLLYIGALAALLLAAAAPAEARMHHPYRGHRIVPAETAPLDGFTQPSGAYSFRKLRSAYSGPAIRIRRASDNAELDINFLGCTGFTGCPWDAAAANAHCASTTCFGRTWYDQSGLVRDLIQTTTANQPQLIFNCSGALPCFRLITPAAMASVASVTPATGLVSISVVGNRVAGTINCTFFRNTNVAAASRIIGQNAVANSWFLGATSGNIVIPAADGAVHAALGVVNGASSLFTVDSTTVGPSSINVSVTAGNPGISSAITGTCDAMEAAVWDNYSITPAERTTLIANQRSFWVP